MDEEGYVYLVDRLNDMIVTGGENVYSIEVEKAIDSHRPAVAQVAVIGIPHERVGRVGACDRHAPTGCDGGRRGVERVLSPAVRRSLEFLPPQR